jgi:Signal transduction histidine kinase
MNYCDFFIRVLVWLLLLYPSINIYGENIDSLYEKFSHSDGNELVQLANTISGITKSDKVYTEDMPRDEVVSLVAKNIIIYYFDIQKFDVVVKYSTEALRLYEQTKDSLNLAGCYHTLGIAYQRLGLFSKAIENYYISNDILEAMDADPSKMRKRYTLNNIAAIYVDIGNLDMAEKIYLQCIDMINDQESEKNNMSDMSYYLSNLSKVYCKQAELLKDDVKKKKINDAINSAEKALDLLIQSDGDAQQTAERLNSLSKAYLMGENYVKAEDVLSKAQTISKENNLPHILVEVYEGCALLENAKGNNDISKEYYHKAIDVAMANGYRGVLQRVTERAYLLNKDKNSEIALKYFEMFVAIRDSNYNVESQKQLNEFQVKYDTQQKELEIVQQQAEISRYKSNRIIFIISLSLSALVLILLWWMLRLRNKRNRVLSEINATKDKFFSIISHDLKNPAIAQRNALQQLISYSKEWDSELLAQYYNELLRSADGQVELLYNLLNWAQVQTGRMPYNPIQFDLVEALRSDVILIENMSKRKGVATDIDIPDTAVVTGDSNMITTVVRNLLTNAVKFTPSGGTISLGIEPLPSKNNAFTITVSDTGMGMSEEQQRSLFNLDHQRSRKGTSGESGSGLGLIVCKELVEKHDSVLHLESTENQGSRFWFVLSNFTYTN